MSQSTASRRWDLLRPPARRAAASIVPHPGEVLGGSSAPVDGTITPTWDWKHVPDLFSSKTGHAGMNVQVAASLDGQIAAVGPIAVHGAPPRRVPGRVVARTCRLLHDGTSRTWEYWCM